MPNARYDGLGLDGFAGCTHKGADWRSAFGGQSEQHLLILSLSSLTRTGPGGFPGVRRAFVGYPTLHRS